MFGDLLPCQVNPSSTFPAVAEITVNKGNQIVLADGAEDGSANTSLKTPSGSHDFESRFPTDHAEFLKHKTETVANSANYYKT